MYISASESQDFQKFQRGPLSETRTGVKLALESALPIVSQISYSM